MTINSETRVAGPFEGNDSTVAFPFTFKVFAADEVLVVSATNSAETVLVLGSHYSVTLNPDQDSAPGGTVTLSAPLASGTRLTLTSALEYLQPTDLTNQGGFYPRVINNALDRLTILQQQLFERLGRALVFPISDGPVGEIPGAGVRAGTVLAFDEATGDPVVGPKITDVNTVAGFIDSVNTVADNIADVNTVAGNIADVNTVAGNIADVNTVADNIADVNTVAGNIADVNTVADNLADVSNFAGVYYGPNENDPTTRRDGSPLQAGDLYLNTSTGALRAYTGGTWRESVSGTVTVQNLSGTGAQTEFLLNYAPESEIVTQVFIFGVYQQKNTYELGGVGGDLLQFDTAPPAGVNNIEVVVSSLMPSDDKLRSDLANSSDPAKGSAIVANSVRAVRTVTDLRALVGRYDKDVAYLTGYYSDTPNMGSGNFVWHSGSALADDGGVVLGSDAAGRWVRDLQDAPVTLHDFGCRPQLGPYADASAVPTAAIEAAVATGSTVLVPVGRFVYGGTGIQLRPGQLIQGFPMGRQGATAFNSSTLVSASAGGRLLTFDYRVAPGTDLYAINGPSVMGLRLISDFPIYFGDELQNIQTDKHIAPILLGEISGNYMQPVVLGAGFGIRLVKCFDYEVTRNEIFDFTVGIDLVGSDINKVRNNRVSRAYGAHIRVFSTGTFGSQNEISGNDLVAPGSVNTVFIVSNDRIARIYDNYLESITPCQGFIAVTPEAVPATIGPNARSTVLSISCVDNRIDGHAFATNYVYRIATENATMVRLIDSNTTGAASTLSAPLAIDGGGLRGVVASGNVPAHYQIAGAVFGLWDGFRSRGGKLGVNWLEIDGSCVKALEIGSASNPDVRITSPFTFELPSGLADGTSMQLWPLGRAGRTLRPYLSAGATYTVEAIVSTSNSGGVPVTVSAASTAGALGGVTTNVGQLFLKVTFSFTAPAAGATDFTVSVAKGVGAAASAVRFHGLKVFRA